MKCERVFACFWCVLPPCPTSGLATEWRGAQKCVESGPCFVWGLLLHSRMTTHARLLNGKSASAGIEPSAVGFCLHHGHGWPKHIFRSSATPKLGLVGVCPGWVTRSWGWIPAPDCFATCCCHTSCLDLQFRCRGRTDLPPPFAHLSGTRALPSA